jgi:hypothetical protein
LLYCEAAGGAEGGFDRAAHRDVPDAMLERAVALDQPELSLPGLELQLEDRTSAGGRLRRPGARGGGVAEQDGPRAVEDPRPLAEDSLDRGDEVGRDVREHLHRSRSGT